MEPNRVSFKNNSNMLKLSICCTYVIGQFEWMNSALKKFVEQFSIIMINTIKCISDFYFIAVQIELVHEFNSDSNIVPSSNDTDTGKINNTWMKALMVIHN